MALVVLLSACQSTSSCGAPAPSAQKLSYGVLTYEEGNYQASMIALQGVLENSQSTKPERLRAYKYLAFIHCVSGQEKNCREYFRKALELNPSFELEPTETGHPIWGPVFRSVKSKFAK
ncbi:MAG TPA: TssQ family T6SS-associated lipoprotein [Gallionellaceae bacterium]